MGGYFQGMCHELAARAIVGGCNLDGREEEEAEATDCGEHSHRPRDRRSRRCDFFSLLAVCLVVLALLVFLSVDQSIRNRAIEMALDRLNASFAIMARRRREDLSEGITPATTLT